MSSLEEGTAEGQTPAATPVGFTILRDKCPIADRAVKKERRTMEEEVAKM